jgi:hypothetical protein
VGEVVGTAVGTGVGAVAGRGHCFQRGRGTPEATKLIHESSQVLA